MLLVQSRFGTLKRGSVIDATAIFSVSTKTVQRIWKQGKTSFANKLVVDVSSRIPKNAGRKRVQIDLSKIAEVPLNHRTNLRSLFVAIEVNTTTLHRRLKEGGIRPHTNALKPSLSDKIKRTRLQFCLSMVERCRFVCQPVFKSMYDYVHIDEKWFFMTKESERYYLMPEEHEPMRNCKSKRFITKVMFLAAVVRPHFDSTRNQQFSGKIGIWPFTCQEAAKRSSKNRIVGTLETKAINVNKNVYRSCLIEKVLPAIHEKWPRCNEIETVYVQQDNAKSHIQQSDGEFAQAACKDGFSICLVNQPPQSPDLNVLDLGFFRAIQALQHHEAPSTIDELVNAVEKAFEQQSYESLNHVFLSMQTAMIEIMKVNGGNNYKLPHMGKQRLMRNGTLPTQLQCDPKLVKKVQDELL